MRISDWSSDVCSSDLVAAERGEGGVLVVVAGFVDERLAGTGAKVEAGFFGRLRAEGGGADQGGKQGSGQHLVLAHCSGLLQRTSHEGDGGDFRETGPGGVPGRQSLTGTAGPDSAEHKNGIAAER